MAERKLSGVRVSLPRLTRVRAVSHDAYSGATLTYDDERRDYELCKLESVPGVREDDPLDGAKVALPPQNYTWDAERLLWVHSRSKQPYAEMARRSLPRSDEDVERDPPTESIGSRCMAWSWSDDTPSLRRATVTSHACEGDDLGLLGKWTLTLSSAGTNRRPTTIEVRAPELRAALDLRHHVDCRGEPPALSPELRRQGWSAKQSRSTGDWYYVHTSPNGGATSQWERPGCDWPNAPSCACLGHRTSTRIDSHLDRMERKATLAASCRSKYADYERAQEDRATAASSRGEAPDSALQTYAAWCRARCEAYYESPPHLQHLADDAPERRQDLEAHVDTMYGLMREYDHVASDSEFSDESESEDENEDFSELGFSDVRVQRSSKRRRTERVLRSGLEQFIDSPGVASRILHGDGFNRTRSGAVFGGKRDENSDLRKHLDFD